MSADSFPATSAPPRRLGDRLRARPLPRVAQLRLSRRTIVISLLVMVGVSVWLRTAALHFRFWVDEGLSVGIASHSLSHIPGLMRQDGSPPLYYLILHVWMSVFGRGEAATHELSLVFALLTIPVTYWAASSLFGRRTGIIAALLAAGAPYLTVYAQETRMYALVALLSVVVAGSFVHAFVRRRRHYLPVFALSLAAALYTHNWALFLGAMTAVAFLWCVLRSEPEARRGLWRDGLLAFGATALLFLPWLPTLAYQSQHTGAPWCLPPVIWSITSGFYFIAGGRGVAMLMLLGGGAGLWALRSAPAPATVARLPADGPSGELAATEAPPALAYLRQAAECLLILALGTMLLAWLYSKLSPAWAPRYFAVLIGPLILLFAVGLVRGGRLAMVALVLAVGFWIVDPVPTNVNTKSNVAAVAAAVRHELRADSIVLSVQPEQVPTLTYYLPVVRHYVTPLGAVADPRVVDWRDALAHLERASVRTVLAPVIARLAPGQRVMLVTPVNFPKQPLWMKLIIRDGGHWLYYLSRDSALQRIGSSDAKYYDAGVAVEATVFQRRG